MPYRLTDASALGLDLARTPGGVEAAGVLLRLLLAGPEDVRAPVRPRADLAVARVRAHELIEPSGPTVVDLTAVEDAVEAWRDQLPVAWGSDAADGPGTAGAAGVTGGTGPTGATASASEEEVLLRRLRRLARRLGAVSFGTVADLLALATEVATEVAVEVAAQEPVRLPGPPVDGGVRLLGEVVTDGLLAALLRGREEEASARVLALSLGHRLDPPAPAVPVLPVLLPPGRALRVAGTSSVVVGAAALLERVSAADEHLLLLPDRPAPQVWAQHMHSAAWAVETTGRTRLAAAAQLELLRCLDAAGVSEAAMLGGVWNTCSAAVQAQVVADVLPSDSRDVLLADLLAALPG